MKLNTGGKGAPFAVFHGASYGSMKAVSAHNLWLDSFRALVNLSTTQDPGFVHKHKLPASTSLHMST